jgi:hypothetical protein
MDHNAARQAIADILSAAKLGEVKKICKNATITEDAFVNFAMSCDAGIRKSETRLRPALQAPTTERRVWPITGHIEGRIASASWMKRLT